jgi:hypothetical protein
MLDFPASPPVGTTFINWVYDGTKWIDSGSGGGGGGGATGAVTLVGDVTGTGVGTVPATLALTGVIAGVYQGLTIDAKGRVTAAVNQNYATVPYVDNHTWGYSALPAEEQQLPVPFVWPGKPVASGILNIPMVEAVTIPVALAGTTVFDSTIAAANAVFTVNKISGGVATALGTITVTPGSHTAATLAGAGGSLVVGDTLQMVAPTTQDASLSDVGITVLGKKV